MDRSTPASLFDPLHAEHRFTVDAAASPANAKLPRFWTLEDDALSRSWAGERVFCNPPYSDIRAWVEKGRPGNDRPDGVRAKANAGAPSALIAYGADCAETLAACSIAGAFR